MEEDGIKDILPLKKDRKPFFRQCFVTASAAINIIGHGSVIGFSAVIIPQLSRPNSPIPLDDSSASWVASVVGFALLAGNIIVTPLMEKLGRRKAHLFTILPNITGWLLLICAVDIATLIVARFLQGISMGMMGPLGSIIIAENSSPKNRGVFLSMISLSLTIGVMFSHTIGAFLSWQHTALACSFLTFTSLIMIIYTPESPYWLARKGRFDESKEIFIYLRGDSAEQKDELEKMIAAQKMERKTSVVGQEISWTDRLKRSFRYFSTTVKKKEFYKPIVIMLHMYVMFQFSGINVIASYTTDIVRHVVGPEAKAEVLMVTLDIVRLIANILAVFIMKKAKRRTLLFTAGSLCVILYFTKAGYVYAKEANVLPFDNYWVPIVLLHLYMFTLAIGLIPVPLAIPGEIFPLEYRSIGGGLSGFSLSINFFVAVKCFPILKRNIGLPGAYSLYAGIVVYCLIVIWFMLPETKDRTLQEIEDEFRGIPIGSKAKREMEPLQDSVEISNDIRRCSTTIVY